MEKYMDRIKLIFKNKIFILFLFLLLPSTFALTATSSSYSINMFGNSVSTGNANSNSYVATFLTETSGSTNGASNSEVTSNIGFFETPYFNTVNIVSYSISSRSIVIGNTVGFLVNANNAQNVWVEIVSPNSQTQVINLVNGQVLNYLPVPSIIGRYNVTFYANSSTGAVTSAVDYFELVEQTVQSVTGSGSGGSGGGSGAVQSCTYNWDCTPWSLCANGLQIRSCKNIGTCAGNDSKPIESMACNQALFDLSLSLNDLEVINKRLRFLVNLEEQFGVDELDVHLKYSIINSENFEVFSQFETIAVKGSMEIGKELKFNLEDGNYILRVDVLYGNLQRAFAEQNFVVSSEGSGVTGFALVDYINSRRVAFSVLLLVISSIVLLGGYYSLISKKNINGNSNTLNNIIGLDVYTNNGMKIGKVYDLILHDNAIYGLAVLVEKGVPISHEKVMIRYSYVDNVNDVVVVDSNILGSSTHESA